LEPSLAGWLVSKRAKGYSQTPVKKPVAHRAKKASPRVGAGVTSQASPKAKASRAPLKTPWQNVFAIDLRSLALFRIALGLLLLTDLAVRATDLRVMYTDAGMFPRSEVAYRITSWNWSFHSWGGSWEYEAILFGLAGVLALALLVGFQTRLATIGSWLMLVSIHHRVPAILSGGELLLRMLLFWAMFLPLQRVWSVDEWRARRRGHIRGPNEGSPELSVASAAILLQMALMYFFSAITKTNSQWLHGEALAGIFQNDFFASPRAAWLLPFPRLLALLTWGTLLLEWLVPFLFFCFRANAPVRLTTLALLAAMHVGIAIFLEVGLFSFVSLAGLSLFLPAAFWNCRAFARFGGLSESTIPSPRVSVPGSKFESGRIVARVVSALALIYVLAVTLDSLPGHPLAPLSPDRWKALSRGLGLTQSLGMFGEIPSHDGWYVARAQLKDGSQVDLLRRGAPLDWRRPAHPTRMFPNLYWQKLFREMTYFDEQGFQVWRAPVAEYLCRDWNARHPPEKRVEHFEFDFCTLDPVDTNTPPQTRRSRLVRLDFQSGQERPIVGGYDDAVQ